MSAVAKWRGFAMFAAAKKNSFIFTYFELNRFHNAGSVGIGASFVRAVAERFGFG